MSQKNIYFAERCWKFLGGGDILLWYPIREVYIVYTPEQIYRALQSYEILMFICLLGESKQYSDVMNVHWLEHWVQ